MAIRAIGPSLTAFGVPGALENPILELHDHTGAIVAVTITGKKRPTPRRFPPQTLRRVTTSSPRFCRRYPRTLTP